VEYSPPNLKNMQEELRVFCNKTIKEKRAIIAKLETKGFKEQE
jgi:hypothetical protein